MNARYPTILLALACIACQPADIINIYYGDTGDTSEESTGEPEPDLPPAETETSTETGDGDGDGDDTETSGDGDGDGDGEPGDGDGDSGDGDGEPSPGGLIVESAGERIGYFMGVWDFGYLVWDDVNGVTFKINEMTGHLASEYVENPNNGKFYYTEQACLGEPHVLAKYVDVLQDCNLAEPTWREIVVDGGAPSGNVAGLRLLVSVGAMHEISALSRRQFNSGCGALQSYAACVYSVEEFDIIPVTFPLPITVAESMEP
jgi:hypothetical protein